MNKHAGLIDKLVLFSCCLVVYLYQADFKIYAAAVLISFIAGCLLSYFDDYRVKTFITVGFSILAFIFPEFIFFLPLIAFDMLFHRMMVFNLPTIIPLANFFTGGDIMMPLVVAILLMLSILLRYRVETGKRMEARHKDLIDATREMSIKLEKQNHDLIEKQDNELNLATMNERNRIAREIHDNVGHLLSSAILQSGALKTMNKDDKLNYNLQALHETLTQAMNSIRISVHELYDESVDLKVKVSEIVEKFSYCEISCNYNISSNPSKKLKYAFISILQEALTNIINHSDATCVTVILNEHTALYQLIIRDNGKVKSFNSNDGLGIRNMVDRVHSLNGNINIKTTSGFEIFIAVPKEV